MKNLKNVWEIIAYIYKIVIGSPLIIIGSILILFSGYVDNPIKLLKESYRIQLESDKANYKN